MIEDYSKLIFGNDREGYFVPKYDAASYDENLKTYKAWRTLTAEQGFEEAIDSVNKNSVVRTKEIILRFPYHPDFPEVFFAYLVNRLKGCPPLQSGGVDTFLEGMYGASLERPDCDHMLGIIRMNGPYPIQAPENIDRAVLWLEGRRNKLPAWPARYNEPDAQGKSIGLHDNEGAYPETLTVDSKTYTKEPVSAFDGILKQKFPLSSLCKLLHHLELLDVAGNPTDAAKPGTIAGVVYALRDKQCIFIRTSMPAMQLALFTQFGFELSPSTLYSGKKRSNKAQEHAYNEALAFINELKSEL